MSTEREIPEYAKPALYVGAIILSFLAAILTFVAEFGWWRTIYSWGYDFALYGEFVEAYGKIALVILGLGFLAVAFLALQQLYPILRVSDEVHRKLERAGFFLAISMVVLTIIITIVFVAQVSDATDWDLGTSFYSGMFGGLLSALFFWLARRIKKPAK